MKNLIAFFLAFVLFTSLSFAQKIRFTDATNKWNEAWYAQNPTMHYESFGFDSITVFNSHTYVVMKSYFSPYNPITFAWVREDTVANKVYVVNPGDSVEKLLYDYNMMPGDTTVVTESGFPDTLIHVVSKIDSTRLNGVWHKILYYKCLNSKYAHFSYVVVEGIGCLQGIFFPVAPHFFEGSSKLYCFQNKGAKPVAIPAVQQYFYSDSFDNANSCLLSVKKRVKQINLVKVYPQPASSIVTIDLSNTITSGSIYLVNTMGQTVYHEDFKQKTALSINRNEQIKSGIYFYRISDNSNSSVYTGKIIFQ